MDWLPDGVGRNHGRVRRWEVTPRLYDFSAGCERDGAPIRVSATSQMRAMGLAYTTWVERQNALPAVTSSWVASSARLLDDVTLGELESIRAAYGPAARIEAGRADGSYWVRICRGDGHMLAAGVGTTPDEAVDGVRRAGVRAEEASTC